MPQLESNRRQVVLAPGMLHVKVSLISTCCETHLCGRRLVEAFSAECQSGNRFASLARSHARTHARKINARGIARTGRFGAKCPARPPMLPRSSHTGKLHEQLCDLGVLVDACPYDCSEMDVGFLLDARPYDSPVMPVGFPARPHARLHARLHASTFART